MRPPSLINLTVLEDMCLGHNVADVVIILGSVDIVLGEVSNFKLTSAEDLELAATILRARRKERAQG